METNTFTQLIELIKTYNPDEVEFITKVYEYADNAHRGQTRQSGEEYISHPRAVAYILAEMHADRDTIAAALLHDVIEETEATFDELAFRFGKTVAILVDGVTKISKMNFSSKNEQTLANTRKIISSIIKDVRIIIIKLADRLHNMRTLEFKSEEKQKENALETMEIFVPLAYYIGAYRLKSELEDLSLRYLKPEVYNDISKKMNKIKIESENCMNEMLNNISYMLEFDKIPFDIKVRTKNIYGVYRRLNQNHKLNDIHDLLALKVIVDSVKNCYQTLGLIHSKYPPINCRFKDYIAMPKTNMYQSLHSTVFGPEDRLVQTQIRTFDMDKTASFGLTAYWDINKGLARKVMQDDLGNKFQFFRSLDEINNIASDNYEFVNQVKKELFAENIYVYTPKGEIIELPSGATPIDLAYKIHTDLGNTMVAAVVNGEYVSVDHILKNKDIVKIITNDLSYGPRQEWIDKTGTTYAKRKIREFINKVGS